MPAIVWGTKMRVIKYIIALLIVVLIPLSAYADRSGYSMIARKNAAVSCADCALNDASFIWECNSVTVGDTGFSPCGCSDGDTSMNANDDAAISSGTCVFNDVGGDGGDFYDATISSDDLLDDTVGTVFIRFKVTTWIAYAHLFAAYGDADDKINIYLIGTSGSGDIECEHQGNADYETIATTSTELALNTEYILRYRWNTAASAADHQITTYTTAMVEVDDSGAGDDLTAFTDAQTSLRVGNWRADDYFSSNITIYYVHVYKAWKDTDPNAP